MVIFLPRRWALIGLVAGVLYLTLGQEVIVLGLHVFAIRFLTLAGFVRVMARRELSFSRMNRIDHELQLFFLVYTLIVFLFRSNEGQVFEIGRAVDAFLCYFTFRGLVWSADDLREFLRALPLLLIPLYYDCIDLESYTNYNPFFSMGGIRAVGEGAFQGRPAASCW